MKVSNSNKTGKIKATTPPGRIATNRRKSFNSNLSTNYELMLQIYLLNKEETLSKKKLKHFKVVESEKSAETKVNSSVWSSIIQVVNRTNQFINIVNRNRVAIITK